MNSTEIKKLQEEYTKDIIAWRRHLHQYPEISFEEQETTKYLAGELDKLGIPYVINPEKNTGIVAWIEGPKKGKTIMLRAILMPLPLMNRRGMTSRPNMTARCTPAVMMRIWPFYWAPPRC